MISLKIIALAIIVVFIIYLYSLSYMTRQHQIKAENERQLTPCPKTNNCVFSQSQKKLHAIDAFPIKDNNPQQSWNALINAIQSSGGEILINDGQYCHAVYTSTIFRFKDDFEALIGKNAIDVRSASRAGRSDLGTNRKRVEKIRAIYKIIDNPG